MTPTFQPEPPTGPESGAHRGARPVVEDDGELRAFAGLLWRRSAVIVAAAVAFLLVGLAIAGQMSPRYSATAKVIFEPEQLRIVNVEQVFVSSDTGGRGLQNQVEILRSASLLEAVAQRLRLDTAPDFNPALRAGGPLLADRIAAAGGTLRRVAVRLGLAAAPPAVDWSAVELERREWTAIIEVLYERLRLRPVANSRVIEIEISAGSPQLAAAIVNAVAEQYINDQLETKHAAIATAAELLGTRVQDLENRLNASEEAAALARLELSVATGQSLEITRQEIAVVSGALTAARVGRAEIEHRHERLAGAVASAKDISAIGDFREAPAIRSYRAHEIDLAAEVASARAVLGEGNPVIARLEARLDETRRNAAAEAQNIVAALADDLEAARVREAALAEDLRALETKALEQSRAALRLQRLEREAEANRAVYESFLARMKETGEQASLQTPDARLLSRADPPSDPDRGLPLRVVLAGGGGGIALGLGLAFLLEALGTAFRGPRELEEGTGRAVLATIPRAGPRAFRRERPRNVAAEYLARPGGALAESVRNLRTSILHPGSDGPPRVVMITSSLPGEGKTTLAMLLAIASRQMGRSTVLVDCDLRRRTLARSLARPPAAPDLLDVLAGAADPDTACAEDPATGLSVLAARAGAGSGASAADLVASEGFARMVAALRARHDLVILDTPPTLVATDARLAARCADAVVYLVRCNRTGRAAVDAGLRELDSVGARVAGLALTLASGRGAGRYVAGEAAYRPARVLPFAGTS